MIHSVFNKCLKLFKTNTLIPLSVVVFIIIAFILRLNLLLNSSALLESDDAIYMSMARYFYEGNLNGIIHPIWPPLFPFFSAIFYKFINEWGYAGRMVSVVSGTLLMIPIYLIGKSYANRVTGLIAVLLAIFSYPLLQASYQAYTESLQILLFWIGAYFYLKILDTNNLIFAFLSGIFWGLTFLVRSEAMFIPLGITVFNLILLGLILKQNFKLTSFHFRIIIFIIISIYFILAYAINNNFATFVMALLFLYTLTLALIKYQVIPENKISLFKSFFLVLIGFFIFYISFNGMIFLKYKKSPFTIKSASFLNFPGHFALNDSKSSTWSQDMNSIETFNVNSEFARNFNEEVFKNYQLVINSIFDKVSFALKIFFKYTSSESLIIFFIGVYWLIFRTKNQIKSIFLFTLFTTMFIIVATISSLEKRYFYFAAPLIPLIIAFGINYLSIFLKSSKLKVTVVLGLIFFTLFFNLKHIDKRGGRVILSVDLQDYYNLLSGRKVYIPDPQITNLLKNKRVMTMHEGLGFYSKSIVIYSPTVTTLEELINYGRKWKVDYIIASASEVSLPFLYKEPKDYPRLKLVLSKEQTYIYKIVY